MVNNLWHSIKMGFVSLLTVLLVTNTAFADLEQFEPNSIKNMMGLQSYHGGPNCFNAVLAAKGFVNNLVYTDSSEFRFYTENFCKKKENADLYDVLVVITENTFEHGALSLEGDKIFEKLSTGGLYGRFANETDSRYRRVARALSPYFFEESGARNFEIFSCSTAQNVSLRIARLCSNQEFYKLVAEMRRKFEQISFTNMEQYSSDLLPLNEVKLLIQSISNLTGEDDCSVYAFTVAISTYWNLFHLNRENKDSEILISIGLELKESLKLLKGKIQKKNKNPKTTKILEEVHWIK